MSLNSAIARSMLALVVVVLALATTGQTNAEDAHEQQQLTPIVQLNGGQVQGVVRDTQSGNKVNFYQGIRYGQSKRFQKSTPAEPWNGIYDATQAKSSCPQTGHGGPVPNTNEDCLFLNVWQPAEPKSDRSVMVWIHGGGFFAGSINQYDAIGFAELGDVVVVSINYRLGPLGFLSFDTKEEPGNLGLHDQILGLKWVQENIQKFGGNPQDVTIFGESAGGISVGALVLSPLTTDLFHRAILQSGAPNLELLVEPKQKSLKKTREFAKRMNCTEDEMKSIKKCLNEKLAEELVKTEMAEFYKMKSFFPIYGDDLLPMSPAKLLEQPFNRKLDLMFGVTRDEGTMLLAPMFPEINMQNITLELAMEGIQQILDRFEISNSAEIRDYYTKNLDENTSQQDLRFAVSDVFGDYLLVCPTILFGQKLSRSLLAQDHHSYSYRLMTAANLTVPEKLEKLFPKWLGISHGVDLVFLFDVQFFGSRFSGKDNDSFEQIRRDMITAWTQFARTGQISPISGVEWEEAIEQKQESSVRYFSLNPADYKMVDNYWSETCDRLWKPTLEAQLQTDDGDDDQNKVKTEL